MIYSRLFFRQVLVYPRKTSNTAVNDEELLISLPPHLEGWDYKHKSPHLFYVVLGIKPNNLYVLGKNHANLDMSAFL